MRSGVRHLVAPLAKAGMVAVFLVTLLTTWNSFMIPLMFTLSDAAQTMTVVLALFFQRYLVRGLTLGAVKG